jgi:spore germination protein GerM
VTVKRVLARAARILGRTVMILLVIAVGLAVGVIWWFRHRPVDHAIVSAEVAVPRGTRALELYFPTSSGDGLALETREVVEDDTQGESLVRTVVNALLEGPAEPNLVRAFPRGVRLLHAFKDPDGALYLDFSQSLRTEFHGGSTAEEQLVGSLLRTLSANVPDLSRVTIISGGQPIYSLGGHVRLDGPLAVSDWR